MIQPQTDPQTEWLEAAYAGAKEDYDREVTAAKKEGKTLRQRMLETAAEEAQLDLEEKIAEKAKRRQQRKDNCNKRYKRILNPSTGEVDSLPCYCGLYHNQECFFCFSRRMDYLSKSMYAGACQAEREGTYLLTAELDQATFKNLVRGMEKDDYRNCPRVDQLDFVFIRADTQANLKGIEVKKVAAKDIYDLDWVDLSDTPVGRNLSGKLGNSTKAKEEKKYSIKVVNIILDSDTTKEQEAHALKVAYIETIDLNPTNLEELEMALKKRMDVYLKTLIKVGGKIFTKYTTVRHFSSISWQPYEKSDVPRMVEKVFEDPTIPF